MSIPLPTPIANYVAANARLDADAMLSAFAADAVFLDNGKRFEGRDQIRALFEKEVIPAKAVFTPDVIRREGAAVVVEGPAQGDFPGSPLRFTYRFLLDGDAVKAVEVTI
ncbi:MULTISPECIES: nuclear transport factor 2 family protein [Sphingomonas]|uniref:Nuclear transport factor 2 family protein n=1 Tax=Sphingomonas adhaesiva TaxID=28212 RepID=A0A2A4I9P5_9SPHN|nr:MULTISPECIES: nuclear transport factor 2 family protein [Sphingomonas]PCG15195.1 nuclear transport factor 2 family protein [Sphingomonas adhaesiva]PZU79987.1 MAG: nuclear transport factor 2 family protein [Sphingomonas sp.]